MSDTHGDKVPEKDEHEVYGNARWPPRTAEAARRVVVEAAMHMTEYRDGRHGVTVARNQFAARWTVLDQFGERPDQESFIELKHRPTHQIIGYYKIEFPNSVPDEPDSLDDVFKFPEILPGQPVQGELEGDRNE